MHLKTQVIKDFLHPSNHLEHPSNHSKHHSNHIANNFKHFKCPSNRKPYQPPNQKTQATT